TLATLYKEGRGVTKDLAMCARLLGAAARAGILDAEVEYAIALFNGTGIAKEETAAAALFRKAALRGSPVAQNRLARLLAAGRGVAPDPVAATKWHIVARTAGVGDFWLDEFVHKLEAAPREAGEAAAKRWIAQSAP